MIAPTKHISKHCRLTTLEDGTIRIDSATDVFPCSKDAVQSLINSHNQLVKMQTSKQTPNTIPITPRLLAAILATGNKLPPGAKVVIIPPPPQPPVLPELKRSET